MTPLAFCSSHELLKLSFFFQLRVSTAFIGKADPQCLSEAESLRSTGQKSSFSRPKALYKILIRRGQAARNHPAVRVSSSLPTAGPLKNLPATYAPPQYDILLPFGIMKEARVWSKTRQPPCSKGG